ncbi:MAG: hypothetical protein K2N74_00580, partial [Clostridiales bacterium]|nr:hypothetical protein [Clostridiales bacterium]
MNYEAYSGDDFSRFKNGAIYSYTHPTKAKDYHDAFIKGNTPTDSDVKDVTVNTGADRGTEANPYVITSVAEWNSLAAKATSYTAATVKDKFFVLGCDIDAGSVSNALNPIPAFGGIFCGNGYMISNITMNTPNATNNGRGLFNSASGATISDLRIDMNMTATAATTNQGGLVGYVAGATNILNCQTDVVWNQTGGTSGNFGGLVGGTAAVQVLLYRCSSTFNFTMKASCTPYYGGLIGTTTGGVQLSIFDSMAKTVSDIGTSTGSRFSGGIVGVFQSSNNANINLENIISDIEAKSGRVVWD